MTEFMSVRWFVSHLFCGGHRSMCITLTLYYNQTCQVVLGYEYRIILSVWFCTTVVLYYLQTVIQQRKLKSSHLHFK